MTLVYCRKICNVGVSWNAIMVAFKLEMHSYRVVFLLNHGPWCMHLWSVWFIVQLNRSMSIKAININSWYVCHNNTRRSIYLYMRKDRKTERGGGQREEYRERCRRRNSKSSNFSLHILRCPLGNCCCGANPIRENWLFGESKYDYLLYVVNMVR